MLKMALAILYLEFSLHNKIVNKMFKSVTKRSKL